MANEPKLMPCRCGGDPYEMREWKAHRPYCLCRVICPECKRKELAIVWGRKSNTLDGARRARETWNRRNADGTAK